MSPPSLSETQAEQQLRDRYQLYCKSLRILIRDGVKQDEACRTVCWKQLQALHYCNPRQHCHPEELFSMFTRELNQH